VSKSAGLGDNFYIGGLDVSGDIGSIGQISCPMATQNTTAINKSANERLGLRHDGAMAWSAFWNPGAAADTAHSALKGLTTSDRQMTYLRGTTLGSPAASMIGKQLNYDGGLATDGSLTFGVNGSANAYGLDWGINLTAGKLTHGSATNGTSVDQTVVSTAFGWTAYLHVFAFTGTSVTVKIQDSADNSAWTDLAGASFTAATAIGAERISPGATSTATVRRYVRVATTGTFSNAIFAVNFVRYDVGGHA
jgi:hypothetical protein